MSVPSDLLTERTRAFAHLLLDLTAGCRGDMHEPDEQGVDAWVSGRVFDNAGLQDEITVTIQSGTPGTSGRFNLATLVALARVGAATVLGAPGG